MMIVLNSHARYRLITNRDPRYDGRLFFAVNTTGIYCRPSCPARRPLLKNCLFFDSSAQTEAAGFRACKRCHPNQPKDYMSEEIIRNIHNVDVSEPRTLARLADSARISERHLRRLVKRQTGLTPTGLMRRKRLLLAKQLLTTTGLTVADIAFRAEFPSVRQLNHEFKREYAMSPTQLRRWAKQLSLKWENL